MSEPMQPRRNPPFGRINPDAVGRFCDMPKCRRKAVSWNKIYGWLCTSHREEVKAAKSL